MALFSKARTKPFEKGLIGDTERCAFDVLENWQVNEMHATFSDMEELMSDLLKRSAIVREGDASKGKPKQVAEKIEFASCFNKTTTEYAAGLRKEKADGTWQRFLQDEVPLRQMTEKQKKSRVQVKWHLALRGAAQRVDMTLERAYSIVQLYGERNRRMHSSFRKALFAALQRPNELPQYLYNLKMRLPYTMFVEQDAIDMDNMIDAYIDMFCTIKAGKEFEPWHWDVKRDVLEQAQVFLNFTDFTKCELRDQIEDKEKEVKESKERVELLESQTKSLATEIASLASENKELVARKKAAFIEIAKLRLEVEDAREEAAGLRKKLESIEAQGDNRPVLGEALGNEVNRASKRSRDFSNQYDRGSKLARTATLEEKENMDMDEGLAAGLEELSS